MIVGQIPQLRWRHSDDDSDVTWASSVPRLILYIVRKDTEVQILEFMIYYCCIVRSSTLQTLEKTFTGTSRYIYYRICNLDVSDLDIKNISYYVINHLQYLQDHHSIDWFKGKFTGTSHRNHGKLWLDFRLRFSLSRQPIESSIIYKLTLW